MEMPFQWGSGGKKLTPSQAKAMREVAAALAARKDTPQNLGEGLSSVGDALLYNSNMARAGDAETEGMSRVAQALAEARAGGDPTAFLDVMGNEWASPGQQMIAGELYKSSKPDWQTAETGGDILRWNQNDPNSQPSVFYDGPETEPTHRPMTEEEMAAYGIPKGTAAQIGSDGKVSVIGGGGTSVKVENMGNIPAGYQVEYDEAGRPVAMKPLPGSPAAAEAAAEAAKVEAGGERKAAITDTITNAAAIARDLAAKPGNTGIAGAVWNNLSETEAAELRRQVGVLTSNATIENLTAMRQASPTGGALGSVTEKENAMLSAAAGAIDPNAKAADFQRQLDDYERTLLRIVHGQSEGDKLFEETRAPGRADVPEGVDPELWDVLTPEERKLWN